MSVAAPWSALPTTRLARLAALLAASVLLAVPSGHAMHFQFARVWKPLSLWYSDVFEEHAWDTIPGSIQQSELRFREGDDPHWAAPGYDDAGWRIVDRLTASPRDRGIYWLRLHVRSADPQQALPTGIFLCELGASDFYWDGKLVRSFGRPGHSRAEEIAGPLYTLFELPDSASAGSGEHVIALRLSTYRANRPERKFSFFVINAPSAPLLETMQRKMMFPLLGVGAMCVIGVAALSLWLFTDRRSGLLFFASLAFGGALTVFAFNVRLILPVPYSWSFPIWTGTELVVAATVASLVLLVAAQFNLPHRRWVLAGLLSADVAALVHEYVRSHSFIPLSFMVESWEFGLPTAFALSLWAVFRRSRGAGVVASAIGATTLFFFTDPKGFLWTNYAGAILPTILSFIVAIGLAMREERKEAREAKLTAARLELELLRKSLQPHFLMNTLTALAQSIEENPGRAVQLIDDLAAELRTLARFSQEKQVPLGRELELCRTHLRVMSVRTERNWELESDAIDPDAAVPPALFFTLIENGFTHQQPMGGRNTFRLRAEPVPAGVRYRFFSPGNVRSTSTRTGGGSGLRYVKARLEESWTGAWQFDHRAAEGGWETVIELRR